MSLGKCAVGGEKASVVYPLLPGRPAFCSEHHNQKSAGPFGVDLSGPDDFDIPWDSENDTPSPVFCPPYNPATGVWTDREGNEKVLRDLTDSHLSNILGWINRRVTDFKEYNTIGVSAAIEAVRTVLKERANA